MSDTPVGMMDVYQEFSELTDKFKIMKYKSKVSVNVCCRVSTEAQVSVWFFPFPAFRKWRRATLLRFPTFPVTAST